MMAAAGYDWAGDMPDDGGVYVRKNDAWFCELCWRVADESHTTSDKHLRNLAWHGRRVQQPAPRQHEPPQQLPVGVPGPPQQMPVAAAAAAARQPPGRGQHQPPQQQVPVAAEMPRPQQLPVAAGAAAAAAWQPPAPGPPPGRPPAGAAAEAPPPGPPTVADRMARIEARLTRVEELLMEVATRLREWNW